MARRVELHNKGKDFGSQNRSEKLSESDRKPDHYFSDDPRKLEAFTKTISTKVIEILKPLSIEDRLAVVTQILVAPITTTPPDLVTPFKEIINIRSNPEVTRSLLRRGILQENVLALLGENAFLGAKNLLTAIHQFVPYNETGHNTYDQAVLIANLETSLEDEEKMKIGINDFATFIISPQYINPFNYLVTEEFFKNPEKCITKANYQFYLVQGFLYGKFDEDQPHASYYRRIFKNFEKNEDIILLSEFPEEYESPRLKQLKKFWEKAFKRYWAYTAYSQGNSTASPLSNSPTKPLPPNPHLIYNQPEIAESLTLSGQQRSKSEIESQLISLLKQYSGSSQLDIEVVKRVFNRQRSHIIFNYLTATLPKLNQENTTVTTNTIATDLTTFFQGAERNNLDVLFGDTFSEISDVEKISLIAFLSSFGNGTITKDSKSTVKVIDGILIPLLNEQYDTSDNELDKYTIEQDENEVTEVQFKQAKTEALAKLESFDLTSAIISTQNKELLAAFTESEQQFLSVFKTTFDQLNKVINRREIFISVTVLTMIATYVASLHSGAVLGAEVIKDIKDLEVFQSTLLEIAVILLAVFATLDLSILSSSKADYFRKFSVLKQRDNKTPEELYKQYLEYIKNEYKINVKGMVAVPLIVIVATFFIVIILNYKPSNNSETNISEVAPIAQQEFPTNFNISNSESKPGLGSPTFDTWGNTENLFWVERVCNGKSIFNDSLFCPRSSDPNTENTFNSELLVEFGVSEYELNNRFLSALNQPGTIIRKNKKYNNLEFGVPVGYRLVKIYTTAPEPEHGFYNYISPFNIQLDDSMSGTNTYLVFQKVRGPEQIVESERIEPQILDDTEQLDLENQPKIKSIIEQAKKLKQEKKSTEEILSYMKNQVHELGISYGFQKFPNISSFGKIFDKNPELTLEEQLYELFRTNLDGTLKYPKWDCDLFSFALYVMGQSIKLDLQLVAGNVQAANEPDGGYPGRNHMMIMFRDSESDDYYTFEATLPSDELLSQPVTQEELAAEEEKRTREAENAKNIFNGALGVLAVTILGYVSKKTYDLTKPLVTKYLDKTIVSSETRTFPSDKPENQTSRQEVLSLLENLPEHTKQAIWYVLLCSAGIKSIEIYKPRNKPNLGKNLFDYNQGFTQPNPENASGLMYDFFYLLSTKNTVNREVIELQNQVSDLAMYLQNAGIQVKERPYLIKAIFKKIYHQNLIGRENADTMKSNLEMLLLSADSARTKLEENTKLSQGAVSDIDTALTVLRKFKDLIS